MYIFELLYKTFVDAFKKKSKKQKKTNFSDSNAKSKKHKCNHIFLPVDSTKKILACTNCGMLIKAEDLQKYIPPSENIFEKKFK